MTWDKSIDQREKLVLKEILVPALNVKNGPFGPIGLETESGPLAMVYDEKKGGLRKKWAKTVGTRNVWPERLKRNQKRRKKGLKA